MISPYIVQQLQLELSCLFYGVGITFLYDLLRIIRRIIKHSEFWIGVEDFLYWILVTVGVFLLLYYMNNGNLRWVAVVIVFGGMMIYKKIFGEFFVIFMSTRIRQALHIVVAILKPPLKLVKCVVFKAFRTIKAVLFWIKNGLTGNIKTYNITLCKHFHNKRKLQKKGNNDEPQEIPQR